MECRSTKAGLTRGVLIPFTPEEKSWCDVRQPPSDYGLRVLHGHWLAQVGRTSQQETPGNSRSDIAPR